MEFYLYQSCRSWPATLTRNRTTLQVSSWEFWEIFQESCLAEHLAMTPSVFTAINCFMTSEKFSLLEFLTLDPVAFVFQLEPNLLYNAEWFLSVVFHKMPALRNY